MEVFRACIALQVRNGISENNHEILLGSIVFIFQQVLVFWKMLVVIQLNAKVYTPFMF